jgi:hypothetical protein
MADKCNHWTRAKGKVYLCSKGPNGEPAAALEHSPKCSEHFEMQKRYSKSKHDAIMQDPDKLDAQRAADRKNKNAASARNRELAPGELGGLQALTAAHPRAPPP